MKLILFLSLSAVKLISLLLLLEFTTETTAETHFLSQNELKTHNSLQDKFQIYCYKGTPKYLIHLWQSVNLQLEVQNDDYEVYEASTPESVAQEYSERRSSWNFIFWNWNSKQKHFQLDPFNQSCIGIENANTYSVGLNVVPIDTWKLLKLVSALVIFIFAPDLSRNVFFHYLCGITFGIFASFLVLIYFISKLFPRKPIMYGVVACGWTVGFYLLQLLIDNLRVILMSYKTYVVYYTLATALISFIICYRYGPVTNQRTLNLIQWTMQLVSLLLIYLSTHFTEAAFAQMLLLVFCYNVPETWVNNSKKLWRNKFPSKLKTKLLTNEEFYAQATKETRKGLDDLRRYCSSPECNQWKTILKLNDSKRFAAFVEGQSHLSDQEILEHEMSIQSLDVTDDEDNPFTTDEEEDN